MAPVPSGFTVRRATLDDLDTLRGLWREARLPEHELDRRFTEFQIAVDHHNWILAALAIRFSGTHGEIHSLAIRRADQELQLREALWQRVFQMAQQQGSFRLWTRLSGDFWADRGFVPALSTLLKELPPDFGGRSDGWRSFKVRDEPLKLIAAEEQLAAFLEMERIKTARLVKSTHVVKVLAIALSAVLFLVVFGSLFVIAMKGRKRKTRQP